MGTSRAIPILCAFVAAVGMTGCSSLASRWAPGSQPAPQGLVYYAPMQQLVLVLTVGDKGQRSYAIEQTPLMPDLSQRFVAQYQRSQVTKNTLEIAVTTSGLLNTEQKGGATSQMSAILEQLAGVAASRTSRAPEHGADRTCGSAGVYRLIWDPALDDFKRFSWCGLTITPSELAITQQDGTVSANLDNPFGKGVYDYSQLSGYYYRQALPIRLHVQDSTNGETSTSFPSYVSTLSPTHFLPIPKSLFADSSWSVTFANGVPTAFKPSTDSEILGAVKLPAAVVAAYSSALIAGWTREKNEATSEISYQAEYIKLVQQQMKFEACKAAVATGDAVQIAEKCK